MKRGATKEEIIRITQALIARNGTDAVPDDEVPRRADDFFACYPAFHCYLSVSDSISRPPPRAW